MRALFDRFKQEYLATLNDLPDVAAHSTTSTVAVSHVSPAPSEVDRAERARLHRSVIQLPESGLPNVETAATADRAAIGDFSERLGR
jgi:hypothetical protein